MFIQTGTNILLRFHTLYFLIDELLKKFGKFNFDITVTKCIPTITYYYYTYYTMNDKLYFKILKMLCFKYSKL